MIIQYLLLAASSALLLVRAESEPSCPDIAMPEWGEISCTDETRINSVCTLSCEEHYDLAETTDDSKDITCQSNGEWSPSSDFECKPIRCFPSLQTPLNGDLICSATNLAESLCVFFCKSHYDLVGVSTDKNAYAVCRDDGNGDEIGQWTAVASDVVFPPTLTPVCQQVECSSPLEAPENGKVICSAERYSGSICVAYCNPGYKFKGKKSSVRTITCKDDGNYDGVGQWSMQRVPSCEKCKPVKDVSIMALIHESENDKTQYKFAAKMITKIITVLKRKHRLNPTVRVNRYSDSVDETTEVYTSDFQIKKDRQRIEAIPHSGSVANINVALEYISGKLNGDTGVLAAFIFTNSMGNYGDEADKLAESIRARGVEIFAFTIPQKNRVRTWRVRDMVKLAGSVDMVYNVMSDGETEAHKNDVANYIYEASLKKGCAIKKQRG